MSKVITIVLLLLASAPVAQDSAKDEAQVWQLEKAYWEYVAPTIPPHRLFTSRTVISPLKTPLFEHQSL